MPDFSLIQLSGREGIRFEKEVISVPKWAFKPDEWSRAFLRGLEGFAPSWKNGGNPLIWEIGVGTGVNILVLQKSFQNAKWYFSDFDPRCVPLALKNLSRCGVEKNLYPLKGSWDLITPPQKSGLQTPNAGVIFGCLPQVPVHTDLSTGDRMSHYYDPDRYPEAHLNALGLGLVETLLTRVRKVFNPGVRVILNLAGRPGRKCLVNLFRETGYEPDVVHSAKIEQHAGTSLASLAKLEENGHDDFEFFEDTYCLQTIDAREAESLRLRERKVYHKIYVIAGTLK